MLTRLDLTEEECKLFLQFQKRYAFMQLLESIGIFDIRNGSVTINFDTIGGITNVEKKQVYRQ